MPMKNFTFNFFIKKFCFNEASNSDYYVEMSENELVRLERSGDSPSAKTLKKIIDFAHSYDVLETKLTGYVEMNLN